jgi:hypothetical protein
MFFVSAVPLAPVAVALATGLMGGALSGLFGAGGGAILVPLLRLFLGLGQHRAQGLTLAALMLPSGLPAMIHYHRRGHAMPWALASWLSLGFLPGVWAGARAACGLPEGPLRGAFTAFLVLLAAGSLRSARGLAAARERPPPLWKGALAGLLGGAASGLFGIGGGVVMIPLLAGWVGLSQHRAQVVSLVVMVLPIRLPGLMVYLRGWTGFPGATLAGLSGGFAFGGYLGARLATALPEPVLKRGYAVLLVLSAVLVAM